MTTRRIFYSTQEDMHTSDVTEDIATFDRTAEASDSDTIVEESVWGSSDSEDTLNDCDDDEELRKKNDQEYIGSQSVWYTQVSHRHYAYYNMRLHELMTRQEEECVMERYDCLIWPNGTRFRFTFLNGSPSLQQHVASMLENPLGWAHTANFTFEWQRKRKGSDKTPIAEVRIEFASEITSWSKIGLNCAFERPTAPTLRLDASNPCLEGTVRHELGHMLGLQHEHQRWISDVEFDVEVARPMLCQYSHPDSDIFVKKLESRIDPFQYDSTSLMHYDFSGCSPAAFKSKSPITSWNPAQPFSDKDRKLIAYLYPLPTGGHVAVRKIPPENTRLPKSKRRTVMLPHLWHSKCRVMLGFADFSWRPESAKTTWLRASATSCGQRYFHLEAEGTNATAHVAYLAADPHLTNMQVSSRATSCGYLPVDPEKTHYVELHRLRDNTSSKAKVVTWISGLEIEDSEMDFEATIDTAMRLTANDKTLIIHHRASPRVLTYVDWVVMNPGALNIDGGRVDCFAGEGQFEGRENFTPLPFSEQGGWGSRCPKVMTAVTGMRHQRCSEHTDGEDVWCKIEVLSTNKDNFGWVVRACHERCFPKLSFSWLVVPEPAMLPFFFPKADQKPTKHPRPWRRVEKDVVSGPEDGVDGLSRLFEIDDRA